MIKKLLSVLSIILLSHACLVAGAAAEVPPVVACVRLKQAILKLNQRIATAEQNIASVLQGMTPAQREIFLKNGVGTTTFRKARQAKRTRFYGVRDCLRFCYQPNPITGKTRILRTPIGSFPGNYLCTSGWDPVDVPLGTTPPLTLDPD